MLFQKGTKLIWKSTRLPAYEKLGDDEFEYWVSLDSKFIVESKDEKGEKINILKHESEKPLYKDGKLNRFGFRMLDGDVFEYYNGIMNFEIK